MFHEAISLKILKEEETHFEHFFPLISMNDLRKLYESS